MNTDILVIIMMAFGLFATLMFILFYIYAKKNYIERHLNDDIDDDDDDEDIIVQEKEKEEEKENDLEFVPKKKKVS